MECGCNLKIHSSCRLFSRGRGPWCPLEIKIVTLSKFFQSSF